jgi:hypothetical protein
VGGGGRAVGGRGRGRGAGTSSAESQFECSGAVGVAGMMRAATSVCGLMPLVYEALTLLVYEAFSY